MKLETKFDCGQKVHDKITGLNGTIVSISFHINQCVRYAIQPPLDKDGKVLDGTWVDEMSLELIEPSPVEHKPAKTGGPNERVVRL